MALRSDIRTQIRRELRDPDGKSWSSDEINDLINAGINAVSDLSPLERREDITYTFPYTTTQGAWGKIKEVDPSIDFYNIFRVEILDKDSKLFETIDPNNGQGSSTGWEWWNGKILLPENYFYPTEKVTVSGSEYERVKIRVFGYARHLQLLNDSTESTCSDQELVGVRAYAVAEAMTRLMVDRANFQQWQIASGATNVSISELSILSNTARLRWREEQRRLRKMRRLG